MSSSWSWWEFLVPSYSALIACSNTRISMIYILTRGLYSMKEQALFLNWLKKLHESKEVCYSTRNFLEIIMDGGSQCLRQGARYMSVEDGGDQVRAAFIINDCSLFPCAASIIIKGSIRHQQWKCVSMNGPDGSVRSEICSEITFRGHFLEGEWRLVFCERAIIVLAIVSQARSHRCGDAKTWAAYRFIESSSEWCTLG